jgi:hypothetical protein
LVTKEIATIPGARILNASIEDLLKYIYGKFVINVPELDVHNAAVDQAEAQAILGKSFPHHHCKESHQFRVVHIVASRSDYLV